MSEPIVAGGASRDGGSAPPRARTVPATVRAVNPAASPPKAVMVQPAVAHPAPGYEDDDDDLSLWAWLTSVFIQRYGAACFGSAAVHLLLLVVLGAWFIPQMMKQEIPELVASVADLEPSEQEIQKQIVQQEMTAAAHNNSESVASVNTLIGANGATEAMAEPSISNPQETSQSQVPVAMTDVFRTNNRTMATGLPKGVLGNPLMFANNNSEAVDQIGSEIANAMAKSKVLIIWCFDQSESMKDDREEIMSRVDNMYDQMSASLSTKSSDAVMSVVMSYGLSVSEQTQAPTHDLDVIKSAMAAVPIDTSGYEMQCQAVEYAISRYRNMARTTHRKMMLVLCTDESGNPQDNMSRLESALAQAKAADCSIYVIGREAVFGYPVAQMHWRVIIDIPGTDAQVGQAFVLPIDRGPETAFVEQLQTDGFGKRDDAHPSGFGPYEQARMVHETGGIFFLLPSPEVNMFNRDSRTYDPQRMRAYMPDLSSRQDYLAERDKNPIRAAVWQVINDLNPYSPDRASVLNLRRRFAITGREFASQAREEQEKAMQCINYLAMTEKVLGSLQRERAQEASPRWQANYDLIYAQLPAYRARLYEYGAYLEAFIETPKLAPAVPNMAHAAWDIQTRDDTITGEVIEELIKVSTQRFEQVIENHPGTPWAERAQDELDRGFGVELFPHYEPNGIPIPGPAAQVPPPKL